MMSSFQMAGTIPTTPPGEVVLDVWQWCRGKCDCDGSGFIIGYRDSLRESSASSGGGDSGVFWAEDEDGDSRGGRGRSGDGWGAAGQVVTAPPSRHSVDDEESRGAPRDLGAAEDPGMPRAGLGAWISRATGRQLVVHCSNAPLNKMRIFSQHGPHDEAASKRPLATVRLRFLTVEMELHNVARPPQRDHHAAGNECDGKSIFSQILEPLSKLLGKIGDSLSRPTVARALTASGRGEGPRSGSSPEVYGLPVASGRLARSLNSSPPPYLRSTYLTARQHWDGTPESTLYQDQGKSFSSASTFPRIYSKVHFATAKPVLEPANGKCTSTSPRLSHEGTLATLATPKLSVSTPILAKPQPAIVDPIPLLPIPPAAGPLETHSTGERDAPGPPTALSLAEDAAVAEPPTEPFKFSLRRPCRWRRPARMFLVYRGHALLVTEPDSAGFANSQFEWEVRLLFPNYGATGDLESRGRRGPASPCAPVEGVHYQVLMRHARAPRNIARPRSGCTRLLRACCCTTVRGDTCGGLGACPRSSSRVWLRAAQIEALERVPPPPPLPSESSSCCGSAEEGVSGSDDREAAVPWADDAGPAARAAMHALVTSGASGCDARHIAALSGRDVAQVLLAQVRIMNEAIAFRMRLPFQAIAAVAWLAGLTFNVLNKLKLV